MATVTIPTRTDETAFYSMRVPLNGVEFLLAFKWNTREGAWYFTISDAAGVPIRSGVKVTLGPGLLRSCVDVRRPRGEFIAVDTTGQGQEAGFTDLGDRVLLTFVEV
jgi:hypothetical protein